MPRFTLPAIEKKEERVETISPEGFPDEWDRKVHIPINKEILKALSVGGEAEVTLKGVVESLSSDESNTHRDRTMLTLTISEVSAYSEDDAKAEDDFESGFKNTHKKY